MSARRIAAAVMALMLAAPAAQAGNVVALDEAVQMAEAGDVEAQVQLARAFRQGQGVPKDPVRARELFEMAAARGDARAQAALGVIYARGDGLEPDHARAAEYLAAAAEQGDVSAMRNLATLYRAGLGVTQDEARADELMARVQATASAGPESLPGPVFDARLTQPDTTEAGLKALEVGAAAGDPIAQFQLAILIAGSEQASFAMQQRAAALFRSAADKGLPAAMANLGLFYAQGRALPQDYVLARTWLLLAGQAGLGQAWDLAAALANRMTDGQIAEAESRAAAMLAGPRPNDPPPFARPQERIPRFLP